MTAEVDINAVWTVALVIWGGILAVVAVSLYQIVKTMESEHEFVLDEEEHIKKLNE